MKFKFICILVLFIFARTAGLMSSGVGCAGNTDTNDEDNKDDKGDGCMSEGDEACDDPFDFHDRKESYEDTAVG